MLKIAFVLLGCVLLGGCNSNPILSGKRSAQACPATYIVRDLSLHTVKDPESDQLLAKAYIDRIKPRCRTEDNQISIKLNPQITAQRFHSQKPQEVKTSYFIALVDANNQLIAKEVFPVLLEFDGKERRTYELPEDEYELVLPENIKLDQTKVYAGFQVENHQWTENKSLYTRNQLAGKLP
ncbi:MAG: hypothetical protein ABFQ95_05945 [Pseudomonadota bacterium]